MSHKHLKNGLKYTQIEHDSLDLNENNTNIHENVLNILQFRLEWLENQLNIHQFIQQMFQKQMDILEFKLQIHHFIKQFELNRGGLSIMLAKYCYRYEFSVSGCDGWVIIVLFGAIVP